MGCPGAASQVCATIDARVPWGMRNGSRDGHDCGPEAVASFARNRQGSPMWSDTYAVVRAVEEFEANWEKWGRAQATFCHEHGLIFPVLNEICSARQQLSNFLREHGCDACSATKSFGSDGRGFEDKPEACWSLMQAMLVLAGGQQVGQYDGGRKVTAGWSKAARLQKSSALVHLSDKHLPPSPFLTYTSLSSGSGGRLVRDVTLVTPYHMLLFGGRYGPAWDTIRRKVSIDDWMVIDVEFETAALLGALRAVTCKVLQYAAERAHGNGSRPAYSLQSDDYLKTWRQCVRDVVEQPTPTRRWVSAPTNLHYQPVSCLDPKLAVLDPWAVAASPDNVAKFATRHSRVRDDELPFGWGACTDIHGSGCYTSIVTGESRRTRPVASGCDGHGHAWRWGRHGGRVFFACIQDGTFRWEPPSVGETHVLPIGWDASWDSRHHRHYYYRPHLFSVTTWDFPTSPA